MSEQIPPDDQARPQQFAKIRPPGTAGLPDARQRQPKCGMSLPVEPDADLPVLYRAALLALIADIKRNGGGQKRYEVENGVRGEATSGGVLYRFSFADEAELFEDAQIELLVLGRRVEGSIVSISAGQLLISVASDLGDRVGRATIVVDETALIAALAERIEKVQKGELALNRALADAVVGRKPSPSAPAAIPARGIASLNSSQLYAYQRALTDAVAWIWGPPGCSKTKTLGEIVRSAFEANRRLLICSNTNKAVDQVLYSTCKSLGIDHPAMQEGRVLRLGKVTDDRLLNEFAEYVTIEGIVERRSRELAARRVQIQEQLALIDARVRHARSVLSQFDALDHARELVRVLTEEVNKLAREGKQAKWDIAANAKRQAELDAELAKRRSAVITLFLRSEEAIQRDRSAAARAQGELTEKEARLRAGYSYARKQFDDALARRDERELALASKDRIALEQQVKAADGQREELMAELREIDAKISALRQSIIKDARVLGATCTKSIVIFSGYVTPSRVAKFGDIFRSKIGEGVRVRCVTRPPRANGSIPPELGRQALDMLEGIGVVVDCRAKIHQKVCLVDGRVVWYGSLNALSHSGRSDETMTRVVNSEFAGLVAGQMSKQRVSADRAARAVAEPENPRCPACDARTTYKEGQYGPYFECEAQCGWRQNLGRSWGSGSSPNDSHAGDGDLPRDGPRCPVCGAGTVLRRGQFGQFYGCTNFQRTGCKGKHDLSRASTTTAPRRRRNQGRRQQPMI